MLFSSMYYQTRAIVKPFVLYGRSDWSSHASLVTGGAGFIGSHLIDELVLLGYEVKIFDNLIKWKFEFDLITRLSNEKSGIYPR